METGGKELGEDEHTPDVGVDAVGDRNVNQPVFAGKRDGRLSPFQSEWKQSGPSPAPENNGYNIPHNPLVLKNRGQLSVIVAVTTSKLLRSLFFDYGFSFLQRIESGTDPIFRAKILYIEAWRDGG